MKINVMTTLILAAIGLIADIVTILSVSLSQSQEKISDANYFGLYLIGILVALFSLQLYWDTNKEKNNYESSYWSFLLNHILLEVNIKVLAPFFILTIVFMMTQGFEFNLFFVFLFIMFFAILFSNSYDMNLKNKREKDKFNYILENWIKIKELIDYKVSHEHYIDEESLHELINKSKMGLNTYTSKEYILSIFEKYADENKNTVDFGMIKEIKTGKIIRPDKILINIKTFNLKDYVVVK